MLIAASLISLLEDIFDGKGKNDYADLRQNLLELYGILVSKKKSVNEAKKLEKLNRLDSILKKRKGLICVRNR